MNPRADQVDSAEREPGPAQLSVAQFMRRPAPPLQQGEVHVWRVALTAGPECGTRFRSTLSQDEQERAQRFHFDADRERFIVCRGLLRWLLGRYLELAPGAIRFHYGPFGKPRVANAAGGGELHFNLSHTRESALFAFCHEAEVGADVESARRLNDWSALAQRILSLREQSELRQVPASARPRAFLNGWTRKEAILKATGQGLADNLNQIEVALASDQPPRLHSLWGSSAQAAEWWLAEPKLPPGLVGAVAAHKGSLKLVCVA